MLKLFRFGKQQKMREKVLSPIEQAASTKAALLDYHNPNFTKRESTFLESWLTSYIELDMGRPPKKKTEYHIVEMLAANAPIDTIGMETYLKWQSAFQFRGFRLLGGFVSVSVSYYRSLGRSSGFGFKGWDYPRQLHKILGQQRRKKPDWYGRCMKHAESWNQQKQSRNTPYTSHAPVSPACRLD